MSENLNRCALLQEIESILFNSIGSPTFFQFDDLIFYRTELAKKTNDELREMLRRIENWDWKQAQKQFIQACIHNQPFLPLENPSK